MAENSWWDVMVPRQEANRCDKMALVANCTEHYGTYRPRTKGTYCHEPHQEFKLRIWSSCGVKDFNHRFEQHVGWACAPMSSGEGCFAGTLVQTSAASQEHILSSVAGIGLHCGPFCEYMWCQKEPPTVFQSPAQRTVLHISSQNYPVMASLNVCLLIPRERRQRRLKRLRAEKAIRTAC